MGTRVPVRILFVVLSVLLLAAVWLSLALGPLSLALDDTALAALRLILSACHATVIPNQLALSFAEQAYDDMDRLKHQADIDTMRALVRQLIDHSQRMM